MSMLQMPAIMPQLGDGTMLGSRLAMVARQNADAKVTPVTSYQWAVLLKPLGVSSSCAVKAYNLLPEVTSYTAGVDMEIIT